MPFHTYHFPTIDGRTVTVPIELGAPLFILGPNGSGKSSLLSHLAQQGGPPKKRIMAHRQSWFPSNAIEMTPNARTQMDNQLQAYDSQMQSRYIDHAASQRPIVAIYDIIQSINSKNQKIADAVGSGCFEEAERLHSQPDALQTINELMRLSNMPISLELAEGYKIMARRENGALYSITELSDGERNAFLIASEVMSASIETVFMIDEPERHLHRSIISPLLTELFRRRQDCGFMISTHDPALPGDSEQSSVLVVRSCAYSGSTPKSWDAAILNDTQALPEETRAAIYGGRRNILFVEGARTSLDLPLYAALFPNTTVVPSESCRDVISLVQGMHKSIDQHWSRPWGIIDRDGRSEEELESLRRKGIIGLSFISVESLYYHPRILAQLADLRASISGASGPDAYNSAMETAIAKISHAREKLVLGRIERKVRQLVFEALPTREGIESGGPFALEINVELLRAQELEELDGLIANADWATLVSRYPVRDSGALATISKTLGFNGRSEYEAAVVKLVRDHKTVRDFLLTLFHWLPAQLA